MRFEEAVDRHRHRVFTYASYLLGEREAAEDVTQDVLVKLWQNLSRVEADRLGSWLLRVTRNACFDALRRRRSNGHKTALGGEVERRTADRRPGPGEHAEAASFRRRLTSALAELAEPYRSIVVLREVQGCAYREIAAALDLPLNTVRVYLHRGRRRLRERLREDQHHVAPR